MQGCMEEDRSDDDIEVPTPKHAIMIETSTDIAAHSKSVETKTQFLNKSFDTKNLSFQCKKAIARLFSGKLRNPMIQNSSFLPKKYCKMRVMYRKPTDRTETDRTPETAELPDPGG